MYSTEIKIFFFFLSIYLFCPDYLGVLPSFVEVKIVVFILPLFILIKKLFKRNSFFSLWFSEWSVRKVMKYEEETKLVKYSLFDCIIQISKPWKFLIGRKFNLHFERSTVCTRNFHPYKILLLYHASIFITMFIIYQGVLHGLKMSDAPVYRT